MLTKKQKSFFYFVAFIIWLYGLFAYAIPMVITNEAFTGFKVSDYPLVGTINCIDKTGEQFSFSMSTPGIEANARREGFWGRGDPYLEIISPERETKILKQKDQWTCSDSTGNSQTLFLKTNKSN